MHSPLAFPSMTMVLLLFLWAFPSPLKTLPNAGAGATSELGAVVKALAVEKAAAAVAKHKNFIVFLFRGSVMALVVATAGEDGEEVHKVGRRTQSGVGSW